MTHSRKCLVSSALRAMHGVDLCGQGGTPSHLLESSSELFWATHIGLCESPADDALKLRRKSVDRYLGPSGKRVVPRRKV